ncbi:hypothetical protein Moror_10430 [Moniliophthora roreri MCA 2997]|uniref:Mediator of RNA polymerase II transcription subunit 8 n=2 Tax=Moniliophthora roreri TaxID=221103 RepID=V2WYH6_MONRO|nr:hypothetical protein Moror_10430 [Moniliophthora roreri MCA 2997]
MQLEFDPSTLPLAQLESLRFKANQIIESIQILQRTVDGHPSAMPAWPDILSKYNILLSQTHNFSTSLSSSFASQQQHQQINSIATQQPQQNPYEKIVLHPRVPMTDSQLDTEIIPLLRNQQTLDVLNTENMTVRRLSEHMVTRGSLGVLSGLPPPPPPQRAPTSFAQSRKKPEYEDVLAECAEIRGDHDRRADRAVRAVALLREKFDWKPRVAVEVEEPEELDWDPRLGSGHRDGPMNPADEDHDVDIESADGEDGSDEDEVEGHLVDSTETPMADLSSGHVAASSGLGGEMDLNMDVNMG